MNMPIVLRSLISFTLRRLACLSQHVTVGLFVLTVVMAPPGISQAAIATGPLFIATRVMPNVFFMLDDSGSMDWTILSKQYWHPCAYDPNSGDYVKNSNDCGYLVTNGEMRSYGTD